MDEKTFKIKFLRAELLSGIGSAPDYWEGYKLGLKRAFYGETFVCEEEEKRWLIGVEGDNMKDQERGRGYRRALKENP